MDYPAELYLKLVQDNETRLQWDENVASVETIMNIDENTNITYTKFKKVFIVDPREMLVISRTIRDEQGYAIVNASVEIPEYPVTPNHVRIKVLLNGTYVKRISEKSCEIFSMMYSDYQVKEAFRKTAMKFAATAIPKYVKNLMKKLSSYR